MREIKFRDIAFKAVMYSSHLDIYYVSEPCRIDGGATSLKHLFGFENDFLDEMWDDLFSSEDYQSKFEDILDEEQLEDYALLDWVHIGNLQYTGLKDKNGVEIYEDDLYKISFNGFIFRVVFENGSFYFYYVGKNKDFGRWGLVSRLLDNDMQDIYTSSEVIGNIYENEELLNG